MTAIPQDKVTEADLAEWFKLADHLAKVKQAEHFQRMRVFRGFFPKAKEGTNTYVLSDGFNLKAVLPYNYKVDTAIVNNMLPELGALGVNPSDLIEWKPELKVKAYRQLTTEQRTLFDQALTITEGSPQLEIKDPKTATERTVPAGPATEPQPPGQQTLALSTPAGAPPAATAPKKKGGRPKGGGKKKS